MQITGSLSGYDIVFHSTKNALIQHLNDAVGLLFSLMIAAYLLIKNTANTTKKETRKIPFPVLLISFLK
ncbi:hypothetical protein D3C78_1454420 [compost metagenome]